MITSTTATDTVLLGLHRPQTFEQISFLRSSGSPAIVKCSSLCVEHRKAALTLIQVRVQLAVYGL